MGMHTTRPGGSSERFALHIQRVTKNLDHLDMHLNDAMAHDADLLHHKTIVQSFPSRLEEYSLKQVPSKAHHSATKVFFLGHSVSESELRPDRDKILPLFVHVFNAG